jgi:hypothetical protein
VTWEEFPPGEQQTQNSMQEIDPEATRPETGGARWNRRQRGAQEIEKTGWGDRAGKTNWVGAEPGGTKNSSSGKLPPTRRAGNRAGAREMTSCAQHETCKGKTSWPAAAKPKTERSKNELLQRRSEVRQEKSTPKTKSLLRRADAKNGDWIETNEAKINNAWANRVDQKSTGVVIRIQEQTFQKKITQTGTQRLDIPQTRAARTDSKINFFIKDQMGL